MDGAVSSFDPFCLPDMIWKRMQNTLPRYRQSRRDVRPRKDLKRVADAILYPMSTECQWKAPPLALPRKAQPSATLSNGYTEEFLQSSGS